MPPSDGDDYSSTGGSIIGLGGPLNQDQGSTLDNNPRNPPPPRLVSILLKIGFTPVYLGTRRTLTRRGNQPRLAASNTWWPACPPDASYVLLTNCCQDIHPDESGASCGASPQDPPPGAISVPGPYYPRSGIDRFPGMGYVYLHALRRTLHGSPWKSRLGAVSRCCVRRLPALSRAAQCLVGAALATAVQGAEPAALYEIRRMVVEADTWYPLHKATADDTLGWMANLLVAGAWHVHAPVLPKTDGAGGSESEEIDLADVVSSLPALADSPEPRAPWPGDKASLPLMPTRPPSPRA